MAAIVSHMRPLKRSTLIKEIIRRIHHSNNYEKTGNFYEILEVPQNASQRHIKTAFYKLSQQYHPDKHRGSDMVHSKYLKITEAYETLSKPDKRLEYDQSLQLPPAQHPTSSYQAKQQGASHRPEQQKPAYQARPFTRRETTSDEEENRKFKEIYYGLGAPTHERYYIVGLGLLALIFGAYIVKTNIDNDNSPANQRQEGIVRKPRRRRRPVYYQGGIETETTKRIAENYRLGLDPLHGVSSKK